MKGGLKIGFPAGLLEDSPVRLDVPLCREGAFVVLDKPSGVYLEADGIAENPKTIIGGIKAQEGKPELERLGVSFPSAVFAADPEISGLCLVASNRDSAVPLRNAFGSGLFGFEFVILSERPLAAVNPEVSLPLLRHSEKPRTVVSHRFGKKCSTSFALIEDLGDYQLWSAKTSFLRWHQIRIHAAEAGLRPVGEDTYVRVRKLFLSRLMRKGFVKKGDDERPVYDAPAYHLAKISFPFDGQKYEASAPLPKKFELMLKKIRASLE